MIGFYNNADLLSKLIRPPVETPKMEVEEPKTEPKPAPKPKAKRNTQISLVKQPKNQSKAPTLTSEQIIELYNNLKLDSKKPVSDDDESEIEEKPEVVVPVKKPRKPRKKVE